jgi:hypothetical protein
MTLGWGREVGQVGSCAELALRGEAELRWLSRTKLTEKEAREVEETVDLLVSRWQAGAISTHFVELVFRKLAEEKVRDWLARTGRTGRWGK